MSRKEQDSDGKSVYRHTIKYLGLFGGAHGLSILLNMLRTKISSKLLGVAGMIIALPVTTILISYYKRYVLSPINEKNERREIESNDEQR